MGSSLLRCCVRRAALGLFVATCVWLPSAHGSGQAGSLFERAAGSFRQGAFGEAAAQFEAAANAYGQEGDRGRQCDALLGLAQADQFMGLHNHALQSLDKALGLARALGDTRRTAALLGAVGNVHLSLGNAESALKNLNEGLAAARQGGHDDVAATVSNNLGNLRSAGKQYDVASGHYQEAAVLAAKNGNATLAAEALVNGAAVAAKAGKAADASSLAGKAGVELRRTPDSYAKAYGLINVGLVCSDLRAKLPDQKVALTDQAYKAFTEAAAVAERLGDQRTLSYAYGHLGKLYEDEKQYSDALELTRRATLLAQQRNANEALYKWHWQTGRILGRLGQLDAAISSYRLSIRDLQAIREEMASCYAAPESSYQKTASVVCFELVDLLLQRASKVAQGESADPYLVEARDTLEILKVFELRDYFKDDCVDAARIVEKKLDVVSAKAVVVYPILLPDRVELLASFGGRLKRYTLAVSTGDLTREARELRRKLVKRTTWEFLPHAQKIYDWLIRPLDGDLENFKPDTLVFVPDGPLRTIPMAALHDGKQFLVQRYPTAITPSLSLTDPKTLKRDQAKMLTLGLTRAVQGFPGLPYVADEVQAIGGLYGGELLLDERFRLSNVEDALKKEPFSIVHVASHGQFGGEVADTFLLAFDEKFTMDRFGQYVGLFRFREEPLDLLTLSACETAAGDDRAALGLAGVAVRAGARSALATLWHVNDPAAFELVTEFYRQLRSPDVSRAAALRAGQLKLLDDPRYEHPGYWAPFLLINNWL